MEENGGLLGFLKTPAGQGLLGTLIGGMAGAQRGRPFNTLGRAGLAGAAAYGYGAHRDAQALKDAPALELQKMQLQHTKDQYNQEKDINSMARQFVTQGTPATEVPSEYGKLGAVGRIGSGGLEEFVQPVPATPSGFRTKEYLDAITAKYPMKGMELRKSMQKDPVNVAKDGALVDPNTGQVIYQSPARNDLPPKVQEYLWAKEYDGYKGTYEDYVGLNSNIIAGAQAPYRSAMVGNIDAENRYNLPQPGVVVTLPDGKSVRFPDQASANKFKFEARLK